MKIMLNDTKHPFGHGYCLDVALLDKEEEWGGIDLNTNLIISSDTILEDLPGQDNIYNIRGEINIYLLRSCKYTYNKLKLYIRILNKEDNIINSS